MNTKLYKKLKASRFTMMAKLV